MPVCSLFSQLYGEAPNLANIEFASDVSISPKISLKIIPATMVDVRAGMNKADLNTFLNFTSLESKKTARIRGTGIKISNVQKVYFTVFNSAV